MKNYVAAGGIAREAFPEVMMALTTSSRDIMVVLASLCNDVGYNG
jgi:hypothetical protein